MGFVRAGNIVSQENTFLMSFDIVSQENTFLMSFVMTCFY